MNRYKLSWKDFFKGLLLAVLTPVVFALEQSLDAGDVVINWHHIWKIALGSFLVYICKNYMTDDVKAAEKTLAKQAPDKLRTAAPGDKELNP